MQLQYAGLSEADANAVLGAQTQIEDPEGQGYVSSHNSSQDNSPEHSGERPRPLKRPPRVMLGGHPATSPAVAKPNRPHVQIPSEAELYHRLVKLDNHLVEQGRIDSKDRVSRPVGPSPTSELVKRGLVDDDEIKLAKRRLYVEDMNHSTLYPKRPPSPPYGSFGSCRGLSRGRGELQIRNGSPSSPRLRTSPTLRPETREEERFRGFSGVWPVVAEDNVTAGD